MSLARVATAGSRPIYGLTVEQDGDVSVDVLVVLHSVLNHVEDYQLVELPVRYYAEVELGLFINSDVDLPLFNLVIKRPQHLQNRPCHVRVGLEAQP